MLSFPPHLVFLCSCSCLLIATIYSPSVSLYMSFCEVGFMAFFFFFHCSVYAQGSVFFFFTANIFTTRREEERKEKDTKKILSQFRSLCFQICFFFFCFSVLIHCPSFKPCIFFHGFLSDVQRNLFSTVLLHPLEPLPFTFFIHTLSLMDGTLASLIGNRSGSGILFCLLSSSVFRFL